MNVENIEVLSIGCFGWRPVNGRQNTWWAIANQIESKGWRAIDVDQLQEDLDADLHFAAETIMKAEFRDVDTDMKYIVSFQNDRKLWKLEIKDNPTVDIPKEDKQVFFKSECWKKTCTRVVEILERAKTTINDLLMAKVKSGELLNIDEDLLSKVLKYISDPTLMKNLRLHKYA